MMYPGIPQRVLEVGSGKYPFDYKDIRLFRKSLPAPFNSKLFSLFSVKLVLRYYIIGLRVLLFMFNLSQASSLTVGPIEQWFILRKLIFGYSWRSMM